MKYPGWILLSIGLFVLPQMGFAAPGSQPSRPGMGQFPPAAIQGADGPALASGYRFRPWERPATGDLGAQRRLEGAVNLSRYRFRPLPPSRQTAAVQPVRYRPLQIHIPDRYVFRPLKPAARSLPPRTARSFAVSPASYYPSGANPYAYNSYRPRAYPSLAAGSYPAMPWMGSWNAYPQAPRVPPRYAYSPRVAQGMYRPPRVRPWARRAPWTGYPERYAWRQPVRPWPVPLPAWRYGRGGAPTMPEYRQWQRTAQRPPAAPARLNRYGTDWYDGHADGDGAWYRLVLESAPTVSQSWDPLPGSADKTE